MTKLICIVCPKGCHLEIDESFNVTGNFCKRGEVYAKNEITNPTRTVTSTVKLNSKILKMLPVRTDKPIAKSKMFDVMEELKKVEVNAPVNSGDIIISNILGTNINIIATRTIKE